MRGFLMRARWVSGRGSSRRAGQTRGWGLSGGAGNARGRAELPCVRGQRANNARAPRKRAHADIDTAVNRVFYPFRFMQRRLRFSKTKAAVRSTIKQPVKSKHSP